MGIVMTELSMSLDGLVATPTGGVDHIFDWYGNGPVEVVMPSGDITVHVSEASAGHLREGFARCGACLTGRNTFDFTSGWGGRHTLDVPVVVVSHSVPDGWPRDDAPFFFEHTIEAAVARALEVAGGRDVGVASAATVQETIRAGLLDEIVINLAPVLLGEGIRLFDHLGATVPLEQYRVVPGTGVTHLYYRVVKGSVVER